MAGGYDDSNIPINCSECDQLEEGIPAMEQHVLATHLGYTPAEVTDYVRSWADSVYEQIEAHNMWLTEEYRKNHPRG